jgi:hypothetical protein
MESEFVPIKFSTYPKAGVFFITADGGKLCIQQPPPDSVSEDGIYIYSNEKYHEDCDVIFSFALGLEQPKNKQPYCAEPTDNICYCRTRVADADGNLWEARSLFSTDTLLKNIEDLERDSSAHLFSQTSIQWQQALEHRILLTSIIGFYDDRFYRQLTLGDQIYELLFKYQYPMFDIALMESPYGHAPTLLVRVSNFKINSEVNGFDDMPPFVYEMPCETLMFYSETTGLPIPLVFKKVGVTDQRQQVVQYSPSGVK